MIRQNNSFKKLLSIALTFILLTATGCWDREELEELAYILAIGIDYLSDEEVFEVTTAVIRPLSIPQGEQTGDDTEAFRLITTRGETISTALEQQNAFLVRRAYFAHSEAVIIGENLARKGLHNVLDRFVRERDLRMTMQFYITTEDVKEVMRSGTKIEEGLPIFLTRWQERKAGQPLAPIVDLRIFCKDLLSKGISPVLPRLSTITEQPISPKETEIAGKDESKMVFYPKVIGTAVFNDDKLAGFLNDHETNGLLYVQEDITDLTELIDDPFGKPGKVVIFILRNKTRITPLEIGAKPTALIEITAEGEFC